MISTLNRIESLSEFRRKQFSPKIFDIISEYCLLNAIPSDCVAQEPEFPGELMYLRDNLPQVVRTYYDTHVLSGESLEQLAVRHKVSPSTISNHLATCVKSGLPIHLITFGITNELTAEVYTIVKKNHRDIIRMKPIREALLTMHKNDESFLSYDQLKLIFAIFEYEYGFEKQNDNINNSAASPCISKRKVPTWMTAESEEETQSTSKIKKTC